MSIRPIREVPAAREVAELIWISIGRVLAHYGDQQPQLPPVPTDVGGAPVSVSCNPHLVWVTQRALSQYEQLPADHAACDAMLRSIGADALVRTELERQVERRSGRLVLGPR